MSILKNILTYFSLKHRIEKNPASSRDPVKILTLLKTPYDVWFWAMNMVELKEIVADNYRTPQEVIQTGEGTVFEIVDTMAYLLHHLGWNAVIVSGAEDINQILTHPTNYFVLLNFMGHYFVIDKEYMDVWRNLNNVFSKSLNYVATDWTGEENIFAIMPKSQVKYRVSENFDPLKMP